MSREAIIQKFEQFKVWKNAGERAPHKPLLVLYAIGELLREGNCLIPYSEVDENLGKLLREFGPRRQRDKPQEPFWKLQKDRVGEVTDACKVDEDSHGNVSRRYARFDFADEIYHL